MEVSNALLVGIMFIIILSFGIAAVLSYPEAMIRHKSDISVDAIHIGWVLLILLTHFELFWQTIDLVYVGDQ